MRDNSAKATSYNGIDYRSRTEARWAVFFDVIGATHRYEPKLFELSTGERYLPDFWVEDFGAWFEVKPSNEHIVTEECVKARQLALDHLDVRVWLAMGPPNPNKPNILPLNHWASSETINAILAVPENRYTILEDRRDDRVYWLYAEFVQDSFSHAYCVGGPGESTDHDRLPMLVRNAAKAYACSVKAKFDDSPHFRPANL